MLNILPLLLVIGACKTAHRTAPLDSKDNSTQLNLATDSLENENLALLSPTNYDPSLPIIFIPEEMLSADQDSLSLVGGRFNIIRRLNHDRQKPSSSPVAEVPSSADGSPALSDSPTSESRTRRISASARLKSLVQEAGESRKNKFDKLRDLRTGKPSTTTPVETDRSLDISLSDKGSLPSSDESFHEGQATADVIPSLRASKILNIVDTVRQHRENDSKLQTKLQEKVTVHADPTPVSIPALSQEARVRGSRRNRIADLRILHTDSAAGIAPSKTSTPPEGPASGADSVVNATAAASQYQSRSSRVRKSVNEAREEQDISKPQEQLQAEQAAVDPQSNSAVEEPKEVLPSEAMTMVESLQVHQYLDQNSGPLQVAVVPTGRFGSRNGSTVTYTQAEKGLDEKLDEIALSSQQEHGTTFLEKLSPTDKSKYLGLFRSFCG